jgi:TolB-like protein/Flp pilus assembly protein TadD
LGLNKDDNYLGLGIADALINRLSSIREVIVLPTSSVIKYDGIEQDAVAAGRELGVESLIDGRIQRSDNRIRVTAQLVNICDGTIVWGNKFDEKFTDIFTVEDRVSEQVADALTLRLSGEERRLLTRRYTEDIEAYQLYLKGRYHWNKRSAEGLKEAIDYFKQAIALDASYALAYAGLADCYGLLSNYDVTSPQSTMLNAKAAALRALEIDYTLAEAHVSLGLVHKDYDWDFEEADREFKLAIDLNPGYSTAYHWYAENLVALGRVDEAIEAVSRAKELEPLSPMIGCQVGWVLYHARRYDEAIEQFQKMLEMDSGFWVARLFLGMAYEQIGLYEEALLELDRARELSGGHMETLAFMGHIYAVLGKRGAALKVLEQLKRRSKQKYVSPFTMALIHIGLGNKERALDLLEEACENRDTILIYFLRFPHLDNLRSEQRFINILQRMGLKQQSD